MQLTLVRPTGSEIVAINWIEVYTNQGSFTVLPGHAPLIALLAEKQEITIELQDGAVRLLPIKAGIVQVDRQSVTILVTHE
jgi:F0F1-type ATP synthase epsilon subunit